MKTDLEIAAEAFRVAAAAMARAVAASDDCADVRIRAKVFAMRGMGDQAAMWADDINVVVAKIQA